VNAAHWHLAINHLPVVGTILTACLFAFAFWRRSNESMRTCLGVFVIVALTSVPVFLSGKSAEVVLMDTPDFVESLAESHERAATAGLVAILALGVVALGGLVVHRKAAMLPQAFAAVFLVLAFAVSGWFAWTANLGGRIHHPEIRPAGEANAEGKGN
jgi:hypothetical protein